MADINTTGINFEQLQFTNYKLPAINGDNLNTIQNNIQKAFTDLLNSIMPIGKIEIFLDGGDYSNYMGFKWVQVAEGRSLVGVGTGTDKSLISKKFNEGNNDGEYSHSLLKSELPKTNISIPVMTTARPYGASNVTTYQGNILVSEGGESDADLETSYLGDGTPFETINPSYGVYVWQRYE